MSSVTKSPNELGVLLFGLGAPIVFLVLCITNYWSDEENRVSNSLKATGFSILFLIVAFCLFFLLIQVVAREAGQDLTPQKKKLS